MHFAQRERRFRRGDVDHDHLVEPLYLAEVAQVGLDAVDGGARRLNHLHLRQVGEARDRRPRIQDGAGPDVRLPLFQIGLARVGDAALEYVRALLQFTDGLAEAAHTNVVAADDELLRLIQIDAAKQRQGGDEGCVLGHAAGQRRQAERRRGAHAAEGADQP